jgi:toxin-antitoxin system PIN domain toxin
MTSFFPDLNVWLALSLDDHIHGGQARDWLSRVPANGHVIFSRYTQLGLLRLLTNAAVMGNDTLSLDRAWDVYDSWLTDSRVEFRAEPPGLEIVFRNMTAAHGREAASKWISDCYLLAHAHECGATLVTFDRALLAQAKRRQARAICPD